MAVAALSVSIVVAVFTLVYALAAHREARRIASVDLLDRLDKTRKDRARIRKSDLLSPVDWPAIESKDKALFESFDNVARAYDVAGNFDRQHLVPRRFVDSFFAVSLDDLWTKFHLHEYVEWMRQQRGPAHFWELIALRERTKSVVDWHPATRGRSTWPWCFNPRSARVSWPQFGRAGTRAQRAAVRGAVTRSH